MMTWIKRLSHRLSSGLFLGLLALVVGGAMAPFVPLDWVPWVHILPPLVGVLGLLTLLFLLIFLRQKRLSWALLSLLALATVAWIVGKDLRVSDQVNSDCTFRVVSYNVGNFAFEADRVVEAASLLATRNADVIALQEFRNHDMGGQDALRYLAAQLDMPYYRFEHLPQHIHGAVIYSRYPIVDVDTMFMPAAEINTGIIAAIESPLGRIGVGNLHLSSFRVNAILTEGDDRWHQLQQLLRNSLSVLPLQKQKVDQVLAVAKSYPFPLVLAGDFNAVPHSRIVQPFMDSYTDSFQAAGQGTGWTYPLLGPLGLRIDYQFSSAALLPQRHEVLSFELSDHFPIEVCYTMQP